MRLRWRNGVAVTLNVGDAVYQNDVIQTAAGNSAVGVIFGDGTTFSLSSNARMVLSEFVYNPAPGSANSALSTWFRARSHLSPARWRSPAT